MKSFLRTGENKVMSLTRTLQDKKIKINMEEGGDLISGPHRHVLISGTTPLIRNQNWQLLNSLNREACLIIW